MIKKSVILTTSIIALAITLFLSLTFRDNTFDFNLYAVKAFRMPEIIILSIGTIGATLATLAIHFLTKNKIADIGTIGMTNVNLLILLVTYGFFSIDMFIKIRDYLMPLLYFGGSTLVLFLIYLLTYKYQESANKIILVGIIFSITLSAIAYMLLTTLSTEKQIYAQRYFVGQLETRSNILTDVSSIIAYGMLGVAIILFLVFAKKIIILFTDTTKAQSLGINIKLVKAVLFIIIGLCSSVAFVCLGSIAFIGFIATNIVYLLWKKPGLFQFFLTLIIALALMYGVYLLKHTIISETIPIGIVTNIIAIPYLVFILWKGERHDR